MRTSAIGGFRTFGIDDAVKNRRAVITDLIFDFAERTPEKTALVYNGQPLSYRAFAANVALARGYFASRGVTGSGLAVLVIFNLLDFWVLSLALRSLGLTTVAVQSVEAFEECRLQEARCVVASAAEGALGLEAWCAAHACDLFQVSLVGESPLGPNEAASPERPGGHILLTSGTTGLRKKVLMDPAFEAEFMHDRQEILGIDQDSVVVAFSFGAWTGIGYNSPLSAWFVGATTVIDQGREPHMALLWPGVTHAMVFPQLLAGLLAAPEGAFPPNPAMHLSVTSGAITQAQIDQTRVRITPRIFNRVGSTEVNTFANTLLETPEDHRWHRLVAGREVQIVDDQDRPVPIGEIGLVRVSTAGGPTGYLDDPEATAAFFKDGFFYPGDLAVMREDGRMALRGRATDVINVGGHKILPAPIETRLLEALGVSGVCLFSMQDETGEEQLHVAIETPAPIAAQVLAAALRREIQGYPGVHVHFVSALPRNDTGKIVRRAVVSEVLAVR
jgi:acyl-coenzyme A synthetase/AMP-(fatty) acid ligase